MLNYDQQDALGNMLTGLSRYRESFREDLWVRLEDYSPHQSFTISGLNYYRALNSIPASIKIDIVLRIIDVMRFDSIYHHEVFRTLAYLNVCGTIGFFLMNMVINANHVFGKPQTVWVRTKDEEGTNIVTLIYGSDVRNWVYVFCYDDEIQLSVNKDILRTRFPFSYFPEDDTLARIADELIERDTLTEGNQHFMNSYINIIDADNNQALNSVDFFIRDMGFINANGAYC